MGTTPEIQIVVKALNGLTEQMVKKITLSATANLIEDTPRDTGWARANWVPTIGAPKGDVVGTSDKVSIGDQQSGIARIATGYKLPLGRVFISNNVPYIGRLNDGSSKQAPAGFVQAAIFRAIRAI